MTSPFPHGGAHLLSPDSSAPASDISSSRSGASNAECTRDRAQLIVPPNSSAASAVTGAAGLSPEQQAHKLALIARQEADELRGWYRAIFQERHRAPFVGELDAIKRRADQLGLTFRG